LGKVVDNTRNPTDGKIIPNWEGPYRIVGTAGTRAYHLEHISGKAVSRLWNISNLRNFFQ